MIPNVELSEKQFEAIEKLYDRETEEVLFGGAANGGKSWLGCYWLLSMCYQYPGTKYFIGREELKKLRQSTLLTFFKVLSKYKIPKSDWHYNGQDHYLSHKNGSRIDLLELKLLPSDPFFERFGSLEYTAGWIEEAAEISLGAFDTLKTRVGRWNNTEHSVLGKLLLTCNPNRNWLYTEFYKPSREGRLPKNRIFIRSLATDNLFREKGSLEKLQGIQNKVQRQRLLEGNWEYESEPDQLILFEWIDQAGFVQYESGPGTMGVDVARYGDDESCIAKMRGNSLFALESRHGLSVDRSADWVMVEIQNEKMSSKNVGIDGVGLGAGVVDICRRDKYKVHDIQSGSTKYPQLDELKKYKFKNLRSLMWWLLREDLRLGKIRIELAENTKLFEDLAAVHYSIDGDKMVTVESKDDIKKAIGRSTDQGDALVYANYMRHLNRTRQGEYLTPADVGVYLP